MKKLQLVQSLVELVLDVEKRSSEQFDIEIEYLGYVNAVRIVTSNRETNKTIESKIHYIGRTYGESIEDIAAWLQTL